LTSALKNHYVSRNIKNLIIPLILGAIIAFSTIASITLYSIQSTEYNTVTKEEINKLKADLAEKSFLISQLSGQHLLSIEKITRVMASAKSVQSGEVDSMRLLLDAAISNSSDIIDTFFVLNKDGILIYTTNHAPTAVGQIGNRFPNQVAYVTTRDTMKSFVSPLTLGLDNASKIFVASPIINNQTGEFVGTVAASIKVDTFAKSIEKIITANFVANSESLSLVDSQGYIMYTSTATNVTKNLGKNILSEDILRTIPLGIKDGLIASIREALSGTSGIYELNLTEHPELNNPRNSSTGNDDANGTRVPSPSASPVSPPDYALISYTPIRVDDKIVMISFVTKAASIATLLHQNEILGSSYMFAIMYGILATMSTFAIVIIVINKRLSRAINIKTRELVDSNKLLKEASAAILEQANQLQEADIKKQEFSAMITHELKTPLVAIIGYGSMFLHGKLGALTPIQSQKLQLMDKNAQRLAELIQDILDAQKLDLGQMHLDIDQVSVSEMIEQSINSLRPHAESKGITLCNILSQDLKLECDSGRIVQVLNNLVNNGIKFSAEGSAISIGAQLIDSSIVFSVKDNGTGIAIEKQNKIFTKFYQADTSMTRKAGGTGLGLVISKGIVEAHNGKIWFESQAGKGSLFSFKLPIGEKIDK
jgi:signal transduction histidine kinase